MKTVIKIIVAGAMIFFLGACSNFLDTNPDNIINADDYIKEENEMYTGFLGMISKMQAAGDHAIILDDLRADFLEPGPEAPSELWQIYNYAGTSNNTYADPTCYYSVIVACNDYFYKMAEYKNNIGGNLEESAEKDYEALISSAIRIKVWAYLNLAKTYGKAVWFNDPLTELKDLNNSKLFEPLNSTLAIVEKCLAFMENGVDGINGYREMDWGKWLDPENPTNGDYTYWQCITPNYMCLLAELHLWRGTSQDFEWVRENVLQYLYEIYTANNYTQQYKMCVSIGNNYIKIFTDQYYDWVIVNSILYDKDNGQTNRLSDFFKSTSKGGKYYLRPSAYGISTNHYRKGFDDKRIQIMVRVWGTDTCVNKYNSTESSIPVYRSHDLNFMLAEAEAHLGNFDEAYTILNNGTGGRFLSLGDMEKSDWDPRYLAWYKGSNTNGICGVAGSSNYDLPIEPTVDISKEELIKQYDMALLNEYCLEFFCEGKAFGNMLRMAQRYNDYSIITERVCPKYPANQQDQIRSAILSGGYYVDWDLQVKDLKTTTENK